MISDEKIILSVTSSRHYQFVDITDAIQNEVADHQIEAGTCHLFNPHTTAGLTINEGCDPAVQDDILGVFGKIIPETYPYRHREGNSPSHILATLTGACLTVFVQNGRLQLGTWQRILFCEYDGPRNRTIWIWFTGKGG